MSALEINGVLRSLDAAGVELTALEWDFPRFDLFPRDLGLRFFTIFRDPVERQLSGFAHDVLNNYTTAGNLTDYLGSSGIWTHPNYYVRFFSGASARDVVDERTVDDVLHTLRSNFKYSFFDRDLSRFLRDDVGLPISGLGLDNKTSRIGKMIHRKRLRIDPEDMERLRAAHALDYRLMDGLRSAG